MRTDLSSRARALSPIRSRESHDTSTPSIAQPPLAPRSIGIFVIVDRRIDYAKYLAIADSFQATPLPGSSEGNAKPRSTRNGSATIGFHQFAYSSQWASGEALKRCALTSGHR